MHFHPLYSIHVLCQFYLVYDKSSSLSFSVISLSFSVICNGNLLTCWSKWGGKEHLLLAVKNMIVVDFTKIMALFEVRLS